MSALRVRAGELVGPLGGEDENRSVDPVQHLPLERRHLGRELLRRGGEPLEVERERRPPRQPPERERAAACELTGDLLEQRPGLHRPRDEHLPARLHAERAPDEEPRVVGNARGVRH